MILSKVTPRRDGRKTVALVEIEHRGEITTAEVPASSLASLPSFRRALLSAVGIYFDSWRYEGRGASAAWRDDVSALLAERREEVSP